MSQATEKLIWIATLVLGVLVVLFGITAVNLGGRVPALKPLGNGSRAATEWPTPAQVGGWFELEALTRFTTQTNGINPFFTRHFQPPPPPPPRPPLNSRTSDISRAQQTPPAP